jgi:hypothetical protein
MMSDPIDGFYAVKMSGDEGQGYALIVFKDGTVTGVDPLGVRFDGGYGASTEDGFYEVDIKVTVPPNGMVIQGVSTGQAGLVYNVSMSLPADFAKRDYLRVETPLGAVNAKFERLRGFAEVPCD